METGRRTRWGEDLTREVARRLGYPSSGAYERAILTRALTRDARKLGLLGERRKHNAPGRATRRAVRSPDSSPEEITSR